MKFYVVKKGFIPGIYRSWDQCLEVVKGYAGAIYKSFTDLDSAIKYYNDEQVDTTLPANKLYIFSDGSFKNGVQPKHTFAVLIPQLDYSYTEVLEVSTNNRNELLAILHGLEFVFNNISQLNDIESIVIVSDSEYSLNCISKYSKNWFDSDMNVIDDTKKNIDIFRLIHIVKNKIKKNIEYVKVKSHSNNLDVLSYYNDKVDKLAQNAC